MGIYIEDSGNSIGTEILNNFRLVNGLVKNVKIAGNIEASSQAKAQAEANVEALKAEILERLDTRKKDEVPM